MKIQRIPTQPTTMYRIPTIMHSNCNIIDKKGPTEAKVNGNGMNRHKSAEMRNLYKYTSLP